MPSDATPATCFYCGRAEDHTKDERGKWTVELRPYGPGGAPVCFQCATAPEHERETERNFQTMLDAAAAAYWQHGIPVLSAEEPPNPLVLP